MAGLSAVERVELRRKTEELYRQGLGCRQIAEALQEHHVSTYRRLSRMGLLRSKEEAYALNHKVVEERLPFQARPLPDRLRAAAIGEAIRWFLERGYVPSVPVEPSRYDLVVESDEGLKKVQVKTTSFKGKYGLWQVHVHRTSYEASAKPRGVAGKRRSVSYTATEIDFFFVVTGDEKYLIPIAVVGDAHNITLGKKYVLYKI